jgi:hypothetical protein
MLTVNKEFLVIWNDIGRMCKEKYNISIWNNTTFVAEKIFEFSRKNDFFVYVECGVYKGESFLPLYHLCKTVFENFVMYAVDSFRGFPKDCSTDNDKFEMFENFFKQGRITKEHLAAARERCEKLAQTKHLQTQYFSDYADKFFQMCKDKKEVICVECSFDELVRAFKPAREWYDLVFLDGDLYRSYKDCLEFFKEKTNMFIFDEYYSLKYPGARAAVDEFLNDRSDWKIHKKRETDPYFERWWIERSK